MKRPITLFIILTIMFSLFGNVSAADGQYNKVKLPGSSEAEHAENSTTRKFNNEVVEFSSIFSIEAIPLGPAPEERAQFQIQSLPDCLTAPAVTEKYYNFLDETAKQAYIAVKNAADNIVTGTLIDIPYGITLDDFHYHVMAAFFNDNPQYFWLFHGFGYHGYSEDSNIVQSVVLYSMYFTTETGVNTATTAYFGIANKNEIALMQQSIDSNIAYFTANTYGKTDAQKVRIIHDNLINLIDYNQNAAKRYITEAHSIYGVFADRTAVCDGYARAFQYLLNMQGIECYYITGYTGGVSHAWNLVELNGVWYEVDTTFDDRGKDKPVSYAYFEITTAVMSADHTRDNSVFKDFLPTAETGKTDGIDILNDSKTSGIDINNDAKITTENAIRIIRYIINLKQNIGKWR